MEKKLLDRFDKLSTGEQDILLALSVIYNPVGQTRLQNLLKKSGCVQVAVANIIAKPLRCKLEELELIETTSAGWICAREISEPLIKKAVAKPGFLEKLVPVILRDDTYISHHLMHLHYIKLLRIYLYQRKEQLFISCLENFESHFHDKLICTLEDIVFKQFDREWFDALPVGMRLSILQSYQTVKIPTLEDCNFQYQLMNEIVSRQLDNLPREFVHQHVKIHLLRGDLEGLDDLLEQDDSEQGLILLGVLRFMQNRYEETWLIYETVLNLIKKRTRKRNVFIPSILGHILNLSLLYKQKQDNLITLRKQLKISTKNQVATSECQLAEARLLIGLDVHEAIKKAQDADCYLLFRYYNFAYDQLLNLLLLYWLGEIERFKEDTESFEELKKLCLEAEKKDYFWFAAVSSSLLVRLSVADKKIEKIAKKYSQSPHIAILDLLPHLENWHRSLDALARIGKKRGAEEKNNLSSEQNLRLIWTARTIGDYGIGLTAKEQRLGKNGRWTRGRPVALKRLQDENDSFPYLTEHDRRICRCIEMKYEYGYSSYRPREIFQLNDKAIIEAIGHPHIFWEDAPQYNKPVSVTKSQIQLAVSEQQDKLLIALTPYPYQSDVVAEKTANDDIVVYQVEPEHRQVADILGPEGLLVPKKAKQQVIDSISAIASMLTVHSDIGGQSSLAERVEADSRLHIHLQPIGDGIQIEIFVQPFTDGGPVYKPGVGGSTVLAEINDKQLQTSRNFDLEQQYLEQVLEACPALYHVTDARWQLDDAEMALEALLQLQSLGDFAVLEWPKGKAIRISRETGFSQVQFNVRKEKDWFSVSGEISIDDSQILEMQNLIGLLNASPGRFLKLDDGQIIALTQELRQRLDDLSGLGEINGKDFRFHALAAQALDDITEGMNVKAGKHWREQLKKLAQAKDFEPEVPSTLQGELRDYQLQGYQWMARLAHLGAGACLADDMGLGKTIQSLALMLLRAEHGPTLILAPTSVCNNWLEEIQRFAPTLNAYYFGKGDRQQTLDQADAFDVIVCSYGLLQTEAEKLIKKQWHTIVADEAQAIKNPQTQRSKAAMSLQGDFKLITTGTPIENHLGELWNLFNFINPGLLGSIKKFNERFAQQIENQKDYGTQQRLKKLIQPFILRRLKNDVLTELPARTEITLHIELSAEERTLYEALRQHAMQTMEEVQQQAAPPGQKHLQVLAEIMKLRRACCHPRLIMEETDISSSKLQAFDELVEELIANRHKALVFSQFVSHLALIRELLDKKGISYQYLDGSTSMKKRQTAVNAFQSGEGDVFLISLKAGGAGLNLTAADYVVHMDPWWNPAVEDQASDRAHRIGQKRPVTIYRLVAKDTIEDKIVDLHRHKRDLANSLLEGGDVSGKMSVEDMLDLIREID